MDESEIYGTYICEANRQANYSDDKGYLRPILKKTDDGYIAVGDDDFANEGLINVTAGFLLIKKNEAYSSQRKWYEVQVLTNNAYTPDNPKSAKYSTYNLGNTKNIKPHQDQLLICSVIEGDFPNLKNTGQNVLISEFIPTKSFYLECSHPDHEDQKILIGPLDSKNVKELPQEPGKKYQVEYASPKKNFGVPFKDINQSTERFLHEKNILPNSSIVVCPNGETFVLTNELMINSGTSKIDMASDEDLFKWAKKLARSSTDQDITGKLDIFEKISQEFEGKDKDVSSAAYAQRFERIKKALQEDGEGETIQEIVKTYLNTDEGKQLVQKISPQNLKEPESEAKADNEKLEQEFKKLEQEQQEFRAANAIFVKERKEFEEKKNNNTTELEQTDRIEAIKKEAGITKTFIEISKELPKLEAKKNNQIEEIEANELILENLSIKTIEGNATLIQRLIGLKLDLGVIDGLGMRVNENNGKDVYVKPKYRPLATKEDLDENKIQVLELVHQRMQAGGLKFDQEDVKKLIITTMQNFIVTLAGPPGTGKTSIASSFSKALGLHAAKKNVHIQVQRGWTTDKDIMGFHNKISGTYEKDRFGLYDLINRLQNVDLEDTLSIVTLDEGNLSPLEYYFSEFIGSSDDKSTFSSGSSRPKLPEGLRFIATINNDRTTEILSDRFLDRSPVITLKSPSSMVVANFTADEEGSSKHDEFSFEDLVKIFTPQAEDKVNENLLEEGQKRILQELRDEYPILSLSIRKYRDISNFCSVGKGFLKHPLDDAISLYLLPKLRGQGIDYKDELERLKDYLENNELQSSTEIVKVIIEKSNFDSFSYFSE